MLSPRRDHLSTGPRALDPEDRYQALARLAAQARVEGPELLLRPLRHLYTWVRAEAEIQNLAIQTVSGILGGSWRHSSTESWSCLVALRGYEGMVKIERKHRLATFVHKDTGMEFQLIPGGRLASQRLFIQPFLMARWPVTEKHFSALGASPRAPSRPQTWLSGDDCEQWLKSFEFKLPSAVQWEYACRGTTTTAYYWGQSPDREQMWTRENAKQAMDPSLHDAAGLWNAFGLVDMIGNVWELVGEQRSDGFRRRMGLSYRSLRDMAPYHPSLTRVVKTADTGFRPVVNLPAPEPLSENSTGTGR